MAQHEEVDLTGMQRGVYLSEDTDAEWWNPEARRGAVSSGWAFLLIGQAFVDAGR